MPKSHQKEAMHRSSLKLDLSSLIGLLVPQTPIIPASPLLLSRPRLSWIPSRPRRESTFVVHKLSLYQRYVIIITIILEERRSNRRWNRCAARVSTSCRVGFAMGDREGTSRGWRKMFRHGEGRYRELEKTKLAELGGTGYQRPLHQLPDWHPHELDVQPHRSSHQSKR